MGTPAGAVGGWGGRVPDRMTPKGRGWPEGGLKTFLCESSRVGCSNARVQRPRRWARPAQSCREDGETEPETQHPLDPQHQFHNHTFQALAHTQMPSLPMAPSH